MGRRVPPLAHELRDGLLERLVSSHLFRDQLGLVEIHELLERLAVLVIKARLLRKRVEQLAPIRQAGRDGDARAVEKCELPGDRTLPQPLRLLPMLRGKHPKGTALHGAHLTALDHSDCVRVGVARADGDVDLELLGARVEHRQHRADHLALVHDDVRFVHLAAARHRHRHQWHRAPEARARALEHRACGGDVVLDHLGVALDGRLLVVVRRRLDPPLEHPPN
mmetsp:Transcript_28348/g.74897  ORF Transcript_28348/g.74897 Transcript_28348/m.74897 type:complete len:223 (-) Transcript_28348:554-1222(-)